MADDSRVELLIGGRLYAGWEQAGITRAMDAACGTFNLAVTDRWEPNAEPWPIVPGDECEIRLGGETVISGYVDLVRPSFNADSHTISVQGRDRSADLVDCSAVHDPDEWKNIDLLALANRLGSPFGVAAKAETDIGAPIPLVKLQHGETALEALTRHARMRKVLVMPDGAGGILLTRTGSRRAAVELLQGRNILDASGQLDNSERFSDYIVKGQASYRDETDGETEAHAEGKARDPGVTRYRPMLIVADAESNAASASDRATWEANTRMGRAASATIVVQGWRQTPGGELWAPNMLVSVRSSWLGMSGEMLIRQVTFDKGAGGTVTQLDVVSPSAYEPEPIKQKKGSGSGGLTWNEGVDDDVKDWMKRIGGSGSNG